MPRRLRQKDHPDKQGAKNIMKPRFTNRILVVLATVLLCQVAIFAQEQSTNASFSDSKEVIPVNVLVGQSRLITFATPLERFSVSNPDRKSTRLTPVTATA